MEKKLTIQFFVFYYGSLMVCSELFLSGVMNISSSLVILVDNLLHIWHLEYGASVLP